MPTRLLRQKPRSVVAPLRRQTAAAVGEVETCERRQLLSAATPHAPLAPAANEVADPDDQIVEATAIDLTPLAAERFVDAIGEIDTPFDVDMYAFDIEAGQRLGISLLGGPQFDGQITLFSSQGLRLREGEVRYYTPIVDPFAQPEDFYDNEIDFQSSIATRLYLGVSSETNFEYDPVTGEGDAISPGPDQSGDYRLLFEDLTPTLGGIASTVESSVSNGDRQPLVPNLELATFNERPDGEPIFGSTFRIDAGIGGGERIGLTLGNGLTSTGGAILADGDTLSLDGEEIATVAITPGDAGQPVRYDFRLNYYKNFDNLIEWQDDEYAEVFRGLFLINQGDRPPTSARTLTYRYFHSEGTSERVVQRVVRTGGPALDGIARDAYFREGDGPLRLAPNLQVDAPQGVAGGIFQVYGRLRLGDRLVLLPTDGRGAAISSTGRLDRPADGDRISVGGVEVARLVVARSGDNVVQQFFLTDAATIPLVQRLAHAVSFVNDDPAPNTQTRIVDFRLSDGETVSEVTAQEVHVRAVNQLPQLVGFEPTVAYDPAEGPLAVAPLFNIFDNDYRGQGFLQVQAQLQAGDRLTLDVSGPISTDGDPANIRQGDRLSHNGVQIATAGVARSGTNFNYTFSLTLDARREQVRDIARALRFGSTSADFTGPFTGDPIPTRQLTYGFYDAGVSGGIVTVRESQQIVRAVPAQPPQVFLRNRTLRTTPTTGPLRLLPNAHVADADSPTLDGRLVVRSEGRPDGSRGPSGTVNLLDASGRVINTGGQIVLGGRVVGTVQSRGAELRIALRGPQSFRTVETIFNRVVYRAASDDAGVRGIRFAVFDAQNRGDSAFFNVVFRQPSATPSSPAVAAAASPAIADDDLNRIAAILLEDDTLRESLG